MQNRPTLTVMPLIVTRSNESMTVGHANDHFDLILKIVLNAAQQTDTLSAIFTWAYAIGYL